jgi:hypothetical protein
MLNNRNNKKPTRRLERTRVPRLMIDNQNIMTNIYHVHSNGQQSSKVNKQKQKYWDVTYGISLVVGGAISDLTAIAQNVSVTGRTGDNCTINKFILNIDLEAINADIFSTSRLIFFQWKPNSALVTPAVSSVLQSAAPTSMYNFAFSNQYVVLHDIVVAHCGVAAAPTTSGHIVFFGPIQLNKKNFSPRIEFSTAATTGANKLYMLSITDSVIAPSPNLILQSRILFFDD